jgi:hypothetical protein
VVTALIILALWVALLAPGAVKWVRNHHRTTSIASFHRQLTKLERSGPKLVEPAHRLGGQDGREPAPAAQAEARVPRLVLLATGATRKEPSMRDQDGYGGRHSRRVDPFGQAAEDAYEPDDGGDEAWDDPWGEPAREDRPVTRAYRTARSPRVHSARVRPSVQDDAVGLAPRDARTRRLRILASLVGAFAGSLLLGVVTGLAILFAVTLVSIVALLAYLILMYYASSTGLFGNDALARITPVARTVVPVHEERSYRFDDDEEEDDWDRRRVAVSR